MRRYLIILALVMGLVFGQIPGLAHAQSTTPNAAAQSALNWLRSQQQADGSFPGFGPGESADAIFALVAAGIDPNGVIREGNSPISYLGTQAASYAAKSVGAAAKLTMAVVAAGKDPRSFGGVDLPALIGAAYDPATGQYGSDVFGHSLALLAIRSLGATPPPAAVKRLLGLQLADGGWSFDGSAASGSDTNTTAMAIQALAASGESAALSRALDYLKTQQNEDGGFPYSQASSFGSDSDANSTANVLQALIAAGQDPRSATWTKNGADPISALLTLQNASGSFRYQAAAPDDNALATYQAIPGLLGKSLPLVTANVPDVQSAIAPSSGVPATLPTTGAPAMPEPALILLALLLLASGSFLLRRVK